MRSSTSSTQAEVLAQLGPPMSGEPRPAALAPAEAPEPIAALAPDDPRIARLFEMTSDLLATVSLDGRFTLLNPAWEQVLGWTREELQAHPIHELMHPDDVEPTLALMLAGTHHPAQMENFTTR